jgi:hypothetical protein
LKAKPRRETTCVVKQRRLKDAADLMRPLRRVRSEVETPGRVERVSSFRKLDGIVQQAADAFSAAESNLLTIDHRENCSPGSLSTRTAELNFPASLV